MFPSVWGGFGCKDRCIGDHPLLLVSRIGASTWALRQSKCATFEAPFMFLLLGATKALLIDSGDVEEDKELVAALSSLVPSNVSLVVVHSHPHRCFFLFLFFCVLFLLLSNVVIMFHLVITSKAMR
jgi:hypothetical protein